jgi:hypothetical protein
MMAIEKRERYRVRLFDGLYKVMERIEENSEYFVTYVIGYATQNQAVKAMEALKSQHAALGF